MEEKFTSSFICSVLKHKQTLELSLQTFRKAYLLFVPSQLMEMASNFVKELRDLVKKKPKNGTLPSLSSIDDEDDTTDSPSAPKTFEQAFEEGECVPEPYIKAFVLYYVKTPKLE